MALRNAELLRHAQVTHFLKHGADLRAVQMLLGHAEISTPACMHVARLQLKTLHAQSHPRGSIVFAGVFDC